MSEIIAAALNRFKKELRSRVGLSLDVFKEVSKNAAMSIPPVRSSRLRHSRTSIRFSQRHEDLEQHAFFPLRQCLEVIGTVKGARILEIGPGDDLASGLSFLAAGAASYTAIDRFRGNYTGALARQWYGAVQVHWNRHFPELSWPSYLDVNDFPESYRKQLRTIPVSIEDAAYGKAHQRFESYFDLLCSFQVAEHVRDIMAFGQLNARFLAASGVGIHRVDFGPHDSWARYPDKLTFLRFSSPLWWLMGHSRGTPNRRRFHEMDLALKQSGLNVEAANIELLPGTPDVHKLAKPFRSMPIDSLRVLTATFICKRCVQEKSLS